jgi:prepilin-type N-terminal cleavage/methylation domain-containing protein
MRQDRQGFTLVELLTVIVMVGMLAGLCLGGFVRARQKSQNATAQRYIAAYATSARAAAVQRGRRTTLHLSGGTIWVTADSASIDLPLRPPMDLGNQFGVATSATLSDVTFDPRGFAPTVPAGGARFFVAPPRGGAVRDTVCVTSTGQVRTRGCA